MKMPYRLLILLFTPFTIMGFVFFLQYADKQHAQEKEASNSSSPELPEGVVIKTGTYSVRAEEVLARIQEIESLLDPKDRHLQHAYEYLINLSLLRSEADQLGIKISDDERHALTDKRIEELKQQLKENHGGLLSWENFLQSKGLTEEGLRKTIYSSSRQILLRRHVIHYFEMTHTMANYSQIKLTTYKDATEALANIDAAREKGEKGQSEKTLWEEFQRLALLTSVDHSIMKKAFRYQGLAPGIEELLFETLEPGEYSDVIQVAPHDYRIVMLKDRTLPSTLSYQELQPQIAETIAQAGEVSDERLQRWAAVMQNSQKHHVIYQIPGEPLQTTGFQPKR